MLLLSNWLLDSGISKVCEQSLRWRKPSKHEPELISEESLIMFAKLLSMHIYDWHIRCDILIYILYVHIVCWLCLLLEPVREIVNQGIWQSQCPRSDYNFMLYYAGLVYWDQFPCTTNFPLLILITNSKLCTCTHIYLHIYIHIHLWSIFPKTNSHMGHYPKTNPHDCWIFKGGYLSTMKSTKPIHWIECVLLNVKDG